MSGRAVGMTLAACCFVLGALRLRIEGDVDGKQEHRACGEGQGKQSADWQ
jgi:hypothetical protein